MVQLPIEIAYSDHWIPRSEGGWIRVEMSAVTDLSLPQGGQPPSAPMIAAARAPSAAAALQWPPMSAIVVSVDVAGNGDRAGLHSAIWSAARELIGMYTRGSAYEAVNDYLDADVPPPAAGGWGVD